jgi:hypothetical protein
MTIDRTEGLHRGVTVLRNGGMLGVLIDQHAGDKGVWTHYQWNVIQSSGLCS